MIDDDYVEEEWQAVEDYLEERRQLAAAEPFKRVPQKFEDHNWALLKHESTTPYTPEPKIEKWSNLRLEVWANSGYTHGSFRCDVYTPNRTLLELSCQFDQEKLLRSPAARIYDLLKTDAASNNFSVRTTLFYKPKAIEEKNTEWAFFELWTNSPRLGILVQGDSVWECDITHFTDSYRWTTAYARKQSVEQYWENNL